MVPAQEDDRRLGHLAAGPSWASSEWQATEAGAVQILPYGLDGHTVKEVVGSMQLQRIVLLTDRLQVRPCGAVLKFPRRTGKRSCLADGFGTACDDRIVECRACSWMRSCHMILIFSRAFCSGVVCWQPNAAMMVSNLHPAGC